MNTEIWTGFITFSTLQLQMWQSCFVGGHAISCVFEGVDLNLFFFLFFYCEWTSSLAPACCIWISLIPHCFTRSTSIGCQSLGFTTVELPMETYKTIAILNLEGSLALILQCTQIHIHTKHKHFLSLSACSATHSRRKGQGTSSNTDWS